MSEHAERFTLLRPLLFAIAYEILGSATDADDVLQDSYLRWAAVDLSTVRDSKSYLAKIVSRQALNALRTTSRRREDYVGPWLPEPFLQTDTDAATDTVLAESVSMAMLVLLETLTPDERTVFVLRDVFGFDYVHIAGVVGRNPVTVRQMAHRARKHVQARRRRFEPADAGVTAKVTEQFLIAADTGDIAGLLALLAPDVTWTADSNGKTTASRRRITGADKVGGILKRLTGLDATANLRLELATCNSAPAILVHESDRTIGALFIETTAGKISHCYVIRNPDKLTALTSPRRISR